MKFTELLTPENIRQGVVCSSKKRVFEMIARIIAEYSNTDAAGELQYFESLCGREKLGNTAFGNGVAMPRARLAVGDKPIAVFLQLGTAIDYDTGDNREVDLLFAIMIPEQICADYVDVLAELTERLSDKNLCKQLRAAHSEQEIWQIFTYADHNPIDQIEENDW